MPGRKNCSVFVLVACAALQGASASAQPASAAVVDAFDGRWSVALTCDPVMARGKMVPRHNKQDFFVDVRRGRLEGQHGTAGSAGSVRYAGTIQPDGSAEIVASGHTGTFESAASPVDPAAAYSYTMRGSFAGASGSAARAEFRPCRATFAKQ